MTTIAKGTVLADRYRLVEKLGEGSMGSVWRAEHLTLACDVAIKLLDESIARHEVALARFMREARSAASLKSVHVVQIHDYGVFEATPYIAMELLRGETLGNRMHRLGTLSPAETALILTHVARAIGKAHEAGVIHRDLKPDNIFIVSEDDEEHAKVLDFGVAKAGEGSFAATLTSAGKLLGTPAYMSAEQAAGRQVDHRTDLWALAVIAFECLTGMLPFIGDDLPDLLHAIHDGPIPVPSRLGNVPEGFDAWFSRGVARRLEDRFRSAREMATELRRVCGIETLAAPSADALASARRERDHDDDEDGPESTGTRIAGAIREASAEDEAAASSAFDDIIRTQDILRDSVARPADDILTAEDFEAEGAPDVATDVTLATLPRRRSVQPPPKPRSLPAPAHAPPSVEVAPAPARTSAPPTSEAQPAGAIVVSLPPRRRDQFGLIVGAGVAVVLVTVIAMVGYALNGDAEPAPTGAQARGAASAEDPLAAPAPSVADEAPKTPSGANSIASGSATALTPSVAPRVREPR